jgi:ferredoxin
MKSEDHTKSELWDFQTRDPSAVHGAYYITGQCVDCDLCRETAPAIFGRNDTEAHSVVIRQPQTQDEIRAVEEAVRCCCTEAIQSDGLSFDWDSHPAFPAWSTMSEIDRVEFARQEARIRRRDQSCGCHSTKQTKNG